MSSRCPSQKGLKAPSLNLEPRMGSRFKVLGCWSTSYTVWGSKLVPRWPSCACGEGGGHGVLQRRLQRGVFRTHPGVAMLPMGGGA